MNRAPITTHILNLHSGTPAAGVNVTLTSPEGTPVSATTNDDGRIVHWDNEISMHKGTWTMTFETDDWFSARQEESFYSNIVIPFKVVSLDQHYHVPLLLNAFGFSTYRGS